MLVCLVERAVDRHLIACLKPATEDAFGGKHERDLSKSSRHWYRAWRQFTGIDQSDRKQLFARL
ncbi:MAG: hypothetical protein PVSMB10_11630 [Pseudarthrobacter sp.]